MKRGRIIDTWFPLWIDKWIFGSTRHELIVKQDDGTIVDLRGVFIDLVALAKKDDGYIRANDTTPYPLEQLAGLFCVPIEHLKLAISACITNGKLSEPTPGVYYLISNEIYELSGRHKRRMSDSSDMTSAKADMTSVKMDVSPLLSSPLNLINSSSIDAEKTDGNLDPERPERMTISTMMATWNAFAKEHGLSQITVIPKGSKRERLSRARIADKDFHFKNVLDHSLSQSFLFGENDRGWRMTFDWIIAPTNYPKVLERQYLRAKDQRMRVGENATKKTPETERYWSEREKAMQSIRDKYAKEIENARENGDRKSIEKIETAIRNEIAEWSKEYK